MGWISFLGSFFRNISVHKINLTHIFILGTKLALFYVSTIKLVSEFFFRDQIRYLLLKLFKTFLPIILINSNRALCSFFEKWEEFQFYLVRSFIFFHTYFILGFTWINFFPKEWRDFSEKWNDGIGRGEKKI